MNIPRALASITLRWVFVLIASAVAFLLALYVSLLLTVLFSFPTDSAALAAGFFCSVFIILPGAFLAPRYRIRVAMILAAAGLAGGIAVKQDFTGLLVGVALSISIVWWKCQGSISALRIRPVVLIISGLLIGFGTLVCVRYMDLPAITDPLPADFARALGPDAARISAYYDYDLGGFIDSQHLSRIDAPNELVAKLITDLDLKRTPAVPMRFWKMPPYYWPRSLPSGAVAFQTEGFPADERGSDGEFYFLLHDPASNRAFFWRKINF